MIYAYFDCILATHDTVQRDETTASFTDAYQSHIPCGFGYKGVFVTPSYTKDTVVCRGQGAADNFIDKLQEEYKAITKSKQKSNQ